MKRRVLWLGLGVVWPVLLWLWLGQVGERPAATSGKLDSALQNTLASLAPGETTRFIVHLDEQATFTEASLPVDKLARRQVVVAELQEIAAASQATLQNDLTQLTQDGAILTVQPLWIINALIVTGNTGRNHHPGRTSRHHSDHPRQPTNLSAPTHHRPDHRSAGRFDLGAEHHSGGSCLVRVGHRRGGCHRRHYGYGSRLVSSGVAGQLPGQPGRHSQPRRQLV